ncbi:MAG: LVIVD repeat-containing protein [Halobacteriales archaeon]
MTPDPVEARNVSLVAHASLDQRPGFKMALNEADGRLLLYLAHFWHSGWSIVDVTDPADPTLETFIEGPANTVTKNIQVDDGLMITGLERPTEGYGPIDDPRDPAEPHEEGAYIWDVDTDPLNPQLRGHYETGGAGTHRNFYTGGEYAYMIAWPADYEKGILTVVDVSDPSQPREVGRWWAPGQGPDDEQPATAAFYGHGPAYIRDDRAYLAYGRYGPVILDVSDPTDPTMISRLAMGDGLGSVLGTHSFIPLPASDIAVVTTEAISEQSPLAGGEPLNYTALVDISDERPFGFADDSGSIGPKFLSTVPLPTPEEHLPYDNYYEKPGRFGPHNLHHPRAEPLRYQSNERLVMTWFNAGLRIFDIADPLAPTEIGYYVPDDPDERIGTRPSSGLVTHFEDVVVDHRGYMYCTDPNAGLFVFESTVL